MTKEAMYDITNKAETTSVKLDCLYTAICAVHDYFDSNKPEPITLLIDYDRTGSMCQIALDYICMVQKMVNALKSDLYREGGKEASA